MYCVHMLVCIYAVYVGILRKVVSGSFFPCSRWARDTMELMVQFWCRIGEPGATWEGLVQEQKKTMFLLRSTSTNKNMMSSCFLLCAAPEQIEWSSFALLRTHPFSSAQQFKYWCLSRTFSDNPRNRHLIWAPLGTITWTASLTWLLLFV